MAWSAIWPLTSSTPLQDIQEFAIHNELFLAFEERGYPFSDDYHPWPTVGTIWAQGAISALVDNMDGTWTLTDSALAAAPGTDDGRYWNGVERTGCGTHVPYWVGLSCSSTPYLNGMYDVIIEYNDGTATWWRTVKPQWAMRGNIVANTSQTLSFTANLENFATAKMIPSTSALVGMRYYILRTGRPWRYDINPKFGRLPDWPNDNELWRGTIDGADEDVGKVYDDGKGYIQEHKNKFIQNPYYDNTRKPNGWKDFVGKEVLTFGDDLGNLHRLTVTKNTGNTIFFGGLDHIPTVDEEAYLTVDYNLSGDFAVVEVNAMCWPGHRAWYPFRWHSGYHKVYFGHGPDHNGQDPLPTFAAILAGDDYVYHYGGDLSADCAADATRVTVNTLYTDVHTPFDNFCSPADFFPGIQIHKSWGQLQADIEARVGDYIRPVSYVSAKQIPPYALARAFYDCSINAGTATVAKTSVSVGGGNTHSTYYFTVSPDKYKNKFIFYEVVQSGLRQNAFFNDGAGSDATTGNVVVYDATTDATGTAINDANWLGASVWWSAGWTRVYEDIFERMHPIGGLFIPDIDTDDLGNQFPVLPPAPVDFAMFGSFGVGMWLPVIEPSSAYKIYQQTGEALDNGGVNFVEDKVAKFDGQQWHDPGTGQTVLDGDDPGDLIYWDRGFCGKTKKDVFPRIVGDLAFTITDSNKYSITDSSKNLWRDWFDGGELVTHSFTADSGSTTTYTTDSTWGDPTNANSAWFDSARFPGRTAPFVDWILEVTKTETSPDGPVDVVYKLPITDVTDSGTKKVFHFAAVDAVYGGGTMTVAMGDGGRLREPDSKLNRYIRRRLEYIQDDGSILEIECKLSDDKTLFFDARSVPLAVGKSVRVIEYYPGANWRFQTTEPTTDEKVAGYRWQKIDTNKYWVQPYGADGRADPGDGTTPDWLDEMTGSAPVGLNEPQQAQIDFGKWRKGDLVWYGMLNEIRRMINRLIWVQRGYGFDAHSENNGNNYNVPGSVWTWPTSLGLTYANYGAAWSQMMSDTAANFSTFVVTGSAAATPHSSLSVETKDEGLFATYTPGTAGRTTHPQSARAYAYVKLTGMPVRLKSTVDIYATGIISIGDPDEGASPDWPNRTENKFNPDGVSGLLFRLFGLIDSTSFATPDDAATRDGSIKIGPDASGIPNWTQPADPLPHSSSGPDVYATILLNEGFRIDQQVAVVKFDVSGGFSYI